MATIFAPSLDRATDSNGDPISGAKMYFYAANSSTEISAYTDADGLTAHTNPLIASSGGIFAPVFLADSTEYRVKLTDASGTTIWDIDEVPGNPSAADAASAAASAAAAAVSAATFSAQIPAYSTVALGIAGVADGEQFRVAQPLGYDFIYTRTGSVAAFDDARATSTATVAQDALIATEKAAFTTAGVPTDGVRLLATTIPKTGGRMVLNVLSNTAFTLNTVECLYPRDNEGNLTPTRTVSASTDPLGRNEAVSINWASLATDFDFVAGGEIGLLGTNVATVSMYQRHDTDTELVGIGRVTENPGDYFSAALSTTWSQVTGVMASNFNNTAGITLGVVAKTGGTVPFDGDFFGLYVGVDTGPLVVPALADLRAEHMAGHAKAAPAALPGVLTIDEEGWCTPGSEYATNVLIPLGKPDLDAYTLDVLFEMNSDEAGSTFTDIMSFLNTPETGTTDYPYDGQIAMASATGRLLYTNPNLADLVASQQPPCLGNGPMQVTISLERTSGTDADCTLSVWGIPLLVSTETMPDPFEPEYVSVGGNSLSRRRWQGSAQSMKDGDRWKHAGFVERARDDEENADIVTADRAILGGSMPDVTAVLGFGDSLTSFAGAPFMQLNLQSALYDCFIPVLEATGGSKYNGTTSQDYLDATRRAMRQRQMEAMARNADVPIALWNYGTNDMDSGVMNPNTTTWQAGRDLIDAMIFEDVATINSAYRSKFVNVLCTIPPRGDWARSAATADNQAREVARLAYNEDCRDNYASRGYDYLLDWEDGSYIPSGFSSLLETFIDAADNAGNTYVDTDGIHWNTPGGQGACAATVVPLIESIKAAVLA